MRQTILIIYSILHTCISFSQDTLKVYLDKNYKKTSIENAVLRRMVLIKNNHYYLTDQYLDGQLINYCEYISINPWIEDGFAMHYDESGYVYSQGYYEKGLMVGKWIYYNDKKPTDTVDYAPVPKYIKFLTDSCIGIDQLKLEKNKLNDIKKIKKDLIDFVQYNLNLPAKKRKIKENYKIMADLMIDKTGQVKCSNLIDCNEVDIRYEVLRVLNLYKCNLTVYTPIILSIPIILNSQTLPEYPILNNPTPDKDTIYLIPEEQATFQGGDINKFRSYVQDKLIYPKSEANLGISGKVVVEFIVNSSGMISVAHIRKSLYPSLDKEAIKCISNSPRWEPGKVNHKPISQLFVIPIVFKTK
jgi:TonB family protein